jgi:retron-type reverse transcriptase
MDTQVNKLEMLVAWVRDLRIPVDEAVRLTRTAPHDYRHYTIAKRNGGRRDIYHPTPQLKLVQRWLVDKFFTGLPVHDAVHSYRSDRNIKTHAAVHCKSNYFLKFDFVNFFPSITHSWIKIFLRSHIASGHLSLDDDALALMARLVCRSNRDDGSLALSIGAPSSPALSNAILFDLDCALNNMAARYGACYTRYADDVYFSSTESDVLAAVEREFRSLLRKITPQIIINEPKTERRSRKARRVVTGLVITPTYGISIGRDRKRSLQTRVFLYSKGELSSEKFSELAGLIAFAADVEPGFIDTLRRKYGDETINSLLTHAFIAPQRSN